MAATFTPPLAAITTVFTPPCPITWLLTTTKVPSQMPPFPTGAPALCDPPAWDEYLPQRGFEYYSPAICPSGFFVGPSCIVTNPRTGQGFPDIQDGETAAYCIPTGHTCTSDTSDFRGGVWGVLRTAAANGAEVTVGPAIQIRWRAEDLDSLETDPLTPGVRTTQDLPAETGIVNAPPPESTSTEDRSSSSESETGIVNASPPESTSTEDRPSSSESTTTEPTTLSTRSIPVLTPQPSTTTPTSSISVSPSPSSASPPSSSRSSYSSSSSPPSPAVSSPAQESQTSRTLSPSASQSGPQKGNATDGSLQERPSRSDDGKVSNFTVAATVLTTILISLIAGYGAFSILRRYRRYRAGETKEFFVFQIEAWMRRQVNFIRWKWRIIMGRTMTGQKGEAEKTGGGRKLPDAELGAEGPLTELGDTKPFGTKENPAELGMPVTPTTMTAPERFSWRSRVSSRVSRIFPVRNSTRNGSVASGS